MVSSNRPVNASYNKQSNIDKSFYNMLCIIGDKLSNQKQKKAKRVIRCGRCGIEGHNSVQCCSIQITQETASRYL